MDKYMQMNNKKLSCEWHDNALIVNSITCSNSNSIYMGGVYDNNHEYIDISQRKFPAPYPSKYVCDSRDVIYGGEIINHFGHFILESLSRYWYIKESNLPVVFTLNTNLNTWQTEILSLLKFSNEIIFLEYPTKFNTVIVPEQGYVLNKYFHPYHAKLLASYETNIIKNKHIYISRSRLSANTGGYENEMEIENLFLKYGFEIIYPETLSVPEQLYKIYSSELVFGIEGSALHSLVLVKDIKTKFYILERVNFPDYSIIANTRNLDYFLLKVKRQITYKSDINRTHDRFIVDINELDKAVSSLLKGKSSQYTRPDLQTNMLQSIKNHLNYYDKLWYYMVMSDNYSHKIIMLYEIVKNYASKKSFLEFLKLSLEGGRLLRHALYYYNIYKKNYSNSADIHFFISKIYYNLSKKNKAICHALHAHELNKNRVLYYEWLFSLLSQEKHFEKIITIARAISSQHDVKSYFISISYYGLKDHHNAFTHILDAIKKNPKRILYKDTLKKYMQNKSYK